MYNKKSIKTFQIISAVFVAMLGTLLHFTYEWSNNNIFVGLFSAINESTWEHLKLLFFPMLITIIIGYFYIGKDIPNFICAKAIGILSAIFSAIIIFYTYTGILGYNLAILNIILFYISVFIGEFIAYKLMISNFTCNKKIAIFILLILIFLFIFFTFNPPEIGLFLDPLTNTYGI